MYTYKNLTLMGNYAARNDKNYYYPLLIVPLKVYHYSLRNNPEECIFHLIYGGSKKPQIYIYIYTYIYRYGLTSTLCISGFKFGKPSGSSRQCL